MTGLHTLRRTTLRGKRRVGRGQSSTRGKISGRGTKGQNARSGRKKRPELRDIIKKIPKRRGYGKNRGRTYVFRAPTVPVALARLEASFGASAEVTPRTLVEHGIIGKGQSAKIVGGGTVSKALMLKGVAASSSARAAIEKAGGHIT